ncbi:hypothetical protein J1614_009685 [Plenodomus biglobosus]|nr:hypothetical protein J1614_009685 [Plenodomus biglobosus]
MAVKVHRLRQCDHASLVQGSLRSGAAHKTGSESTGTAPVAEQDEEDGICKDPHKRILSTIPRLWRCGSRIWPGGLTCHVISRARLSRSPRQSRPSVS